MEIIRKFDIITEMSCIINQTFMFLIPTEIGIVQAIMSQKKVSIYYQRAVIFQLKYIDLKEFNVKYLSADKTKSLSTFKYFHFFLSNDEEVEKIL